MLQRVAKRLFILCYAIHQFLALKTGSFQLEVRDNHGFVQKVKGYFHMQETLKEESRLLKKIEERVLVTTERGTTGSNDTYSNKPLKIDTRHHKLQKYLKSFIYTNEDTRNSRPASNVGLPSKLPRRDIKDQGRSAPALIARKLSTFRPSKLSKNIINGPKKGILGDTEFSSIVNTRCVDQIVKSVDFHAYLTANPDVGAAINKGQFGSAQDHLRYHGLKEIYEGKRKLYSLNKVYNENDYLKSLSLERKIIEKHGNQSVFEHFIFQTLIEPKENRFNFEFYTSYYEDLTHLHSEVESITHWEDYGRHENRIKNLPQLCRTIGFPYESLPVLNLKRFVQINPLMSKLNRYQVQVKLLQIDNFDLIRISDCISDDAKFYLDLGIAYSEKQDKDKAYKILLYSIYLEPSAKAYELIGNYFLDMAIFKKAIIYYKKAIDSDGDNSSKWVYININKALRGTGRLEEAINYIKNGLLHFPEDSYLLNQLDETIELYWQSVQDDLYACAEIGDRKSLIKRTDSIVNLFSETYREAFRTSNKNHGSILKVNENRVLIVADYTIPQCIRYRIDQKVEQLEYAGYDVTAISWLDSEEVRKEVIFHDIIIYYRVPAFPSVVRSIEKAKALGKITFYEIDDLIFDKAYPPRFETYGGTISIDQYKGLLYGMPLFRASARLCEYAIGSTLPLVKRLSKITSNQKVFLHRNGYDSYNIPAPKKPNNYINLFYGSGTLAHNSDFIDYALGAIDRILNENPDVKLTVVGHLTLSPDFLDRHSQRINILPITGDIHHYLEYLSGADINLAVLEKSVINDTKSELKWFEAAYFEIPSVVSNTQNYIDVLTNGHNAFIAETQQDWYESINLLVNDRKLRKSIGENACIQARREHSIKKLSANIDSVIKTALQDKENK